MVSNRRWDQVGPEEAISVDRLCRDLIEAPAQDGAAAALCDGAAIALDEKIPGMHSDGEASTGDLSGKGQFCPISSTAPRLPVCL